MSCCDSRPGHSMFQRPSCGENADSIAASAAPWAAGACAAASAASLEKSLRLQLLLMPVKPNVSEPREARRLAGLLGVGDAGRRPACLKDQLHAQLQRTAAIHAVHLSEG